MGGGWEVDAASVITSKRCPWMEGRWEVDAASAVSCRYNTDRGLVDNCNTFILH